MILLASRSPQRRALLAALGIEFRTIASRHEEVDEPGLAPDRQALAHARAKAREVAGRAGVPAGGAVLGADTTVVIDGRGLGKPADAAEARGMLAALAGREHEVVTAIVLIDAGGERERVDRARVRVRSLGEPALDWYLASGEWRERAGGYAIQGLGAAIVRAVSGDYTTVVGLPVAALLDLLEEAGLAPWATRAP